MGERKRQRAGVTTGRTTGPPWQETVSGVQALEQWLAGPGPGNEDGEVQKKPAEATAGAGEPAHGGWVEAGAEQNTALRLMQKPRVGRCPEGDGAGVRWDSVNSFEWKQGWRGDGLDIGMAIKEERERGQGGR
ncbi:UNVERIFIED_CONTAM: hypothetical protein K2H54_045390 [Gekko kuhli]